MPQSVTPNLNQRIGVVADIEGIELTAADREFLLQPEICGLIFFARNYQTPQQLKALTSDILDLRPDLLLCVDQEGGRVQRFREGFTRLPAMLTLEHEYQRNRTEALTLAHELGWLMAAELRQQGVHLSFAPVLDIECDVSQVIGDRAFGHDADTVIALASAFVRGMNEAGMLAVGKHFPGHGAIAADSHLALPVDRRSRIELNNDIEPFHALMSMGLLAGIMPAHVIYPAVDSDNTAGFSAQWLQNILRTELQFNGVIFSDDLSMAGAASVGSYAERADCAIHAGANALLVCNDRAAATDVVAAVRKQLNTSGWQRLSLAALQGPLNHADDDQQFNQRRSFIQQQLLNLL